MRSGLFEGCHLYGMPFERQIEVEEVCQADRYNYSPLYWRMRRHFWNRRWPFNRGW